MSRNLRLASMIWGLSILASRVIGLVREAVLGRVLGGGAEADVFWAAFVLPDFLNYLLAGGALSLVFIPIYASWLSRGDPEGGERSFAAIANVLLVLLLVGVGAMWWGAPWLVQGVAPGFAPEQSAELLRLTRIVLPAQIFHLGGGLLSAVLQARDRHALPALAPLVYTSCVVAGGLIGQSAEGFAWGVVVGSALGPFGLPWWGVRQLGFRWRLGLDLRHPDLRLWLWRSLPIMLGFSVVAVDDWVLRNLASSLPAGAISTLQYAKTLMKVPMGVFGLATGVAAFPTLARLVGEGKPAEAYRTLVRALRLMLVLALAAQVGLTVAGGPVAALLYGGLAREQLLEIEVALGLFGLGLWAWAAQTVVSRGFYARGQTWLPTLVGTAVAGLALPAYVLLRDAAGLYGLAGASTLAISTYVGVLLVLLRRSFPEVQDGLPGFLARGALAVLGGVAVGLAVRWPFGREPTGLVALVGAGLAGSLGIGAFSLVAAALGMGEVGELVGRLQHQLRVSWGRLTRRKDT